jgi:P4 family phage/plasmid primase-like protien
LTEQLKPVPIIGLIARADNPKKKQVVYKQECWGDQTTEDLIRNLPFHLSKIPAHCRNDLFFTIAETEDKEKERRLIVQKFMPFDIDGIDTMRAEETAQAVCDYLKIDYKKTFIVMTGGGLHLGILLDESIHSLEALLSMQEAYSVVCRGISANLELRAIVGAADPQFLSEGRMFRLPGSVNTKYGTSGMEVELINGNIEPVSFDIFALSGTVATKTKEKKEPHPDYVAMTPQTTDPEAVQNLCLFLKHCENHPEKLSEPEWFADIGVRAFLPNGKERIHEIHSKYSGYQKQETQEKIESVTSNQTGPRKCESIARSTGFDCSGCKFYRRVATPLQIRSPDSVNFEESGFRIPQRSKPASSWPVSYDDLVKKFKEDFVYFASRETGLIYVYSDNYWQAWEDLPIFNWAYGKISPTSKRGERNEFFHCLQDAVQRDEKTLQTSTYKKLNFQNGVYDVPTRRLLPHSPDYGFRHILPFSFDPGARCPRFDRFLTEILPGDKENQDAIMEFMAYGLFNDECWLQKALFFIGEGRNGKSTLLDVITALAGKENTLEIGFHSLVDKDTKRAMLENKLFCISEETKSTTLLESDMFKLLVAGGTVDVKKIYVKDYQIKNKAKFIMSFNSITASRDKTHALYRRIRMIHFNQTFKVDGTIKKELHAELPGIFNKVLEAYERLNTQGQLTESVMSERMLENFKRDNDSCYTFLTDHYRVGEDNDSFIPKQDLYNNFCQYFDENGYSRNAKPDIKTFMKSVKTFMGPLFTETRRRHTGGLKYGLVNLITLDHEQ